MLSLFFYFKIFFSHQFTELKRSSLFAHDLWINVLIILFISIIMSVIIYTILLTDHILKNALEVENTLQFIHADFVKSLILYIHIRIQTQKVASINTKYYKHLPIPNSVIIKYVIFSSQLNFLGFLPVVLITPVYAKYLLFMGKPQVTYFLIYLIGLLLVCIASNFIHALVKRSLGKGYLVFIIFLVFSVIVLNSNMIEIWSVNYFINLIENTLLSIGLLTIFIYLLAIISFYYFSKNIYIDLKN